jgi:uncharacterized protein (TIGR03083 family)
MSIPSEADVSVASEDDLMAEVATACTALAEVLERQSSSDWDRRSLCTEWRVREVVAHLTMAVRYAPDAFMAELQEADGDFTVLANRVAARDGALPTSTLVANLRDEHLHRWRPPGGGAMGALTHVTIHGLDVTVPLALAPTSTATAQRLVLDGLVAGGDQNHFGVPIDGVALQATDLDWTSGAGEPVTGTAAQLILRLSGRRLA